MEIQPLDEVDFVLPWQESTNPNVILLPEASGFSIDWAIDAARGLLLDAIAQSPPDLLLINWIDTTAVFENLAGFSEFARKAPAFFRYQAMHTTAEMKRVLDAIWLEVEDVYDSCISHNFRDLADHNKFATNAEAYRVLIVTGFPQRFDKRSAEILARLSRHGRRAGLSLILVADPVVANSLASINRLGHIHELQDIPVSIDSLPSWWGPDTLPSGRLIIGANNRSYTPTLVAQGDVTYLTICRLNIRMTTIFVEFLRTILTSAACPPKWEYRRARWRNFEKIQSHVVPVCCARCCTGFGMRPCTAADRATGRALSAPGIAT